MNLYNNILNSFYKLRKAFWNYPNSLFFNSDSVFNSIKAFYYSSIPLSHIVASITFMLLLVFQINTNSSPFISIEKNTLIEGIVMGVDEQGNTNAINRINPLISTNIQLEKDLSELIYESLISVDEEGNAKPQLADFFTIEAGKRYQFKLKPNTYWSDGVKLTSDDVLATFELIKSLESNSQLSNLYSKAANKIEIVKSDIDPDVFEFKVIGDNVIPGFFEAISFKIMPAHLLSELNPESIAKSDPIINRNPIGTGQYKLSLASSESIVLVQNQYYQGLKSKITEIKFKFFPNEDLAIKALKSGQIHSIAGISISAINNFDKKTNINLLQSDVFYNQFWGLFFNLGETGPAQLKDMRIRQAISSAINKDEIINALSGFGERTESPIPKTSFAYSDQVKYPFNINKANELLDQSGYLPNEEKIRSKDNVKLSFTLIYVNNGDRKKVAELIKTQLATIGIEIILKDVDLQTSVEEYIIPRKYELLLYGVQTLIDPDRYELFHSSQKSHPGLNIMAYTSESKRTQVVEGKTEKVPSVDDDLDDARRLIDEKVRKRKYDDFQTIIYTEIPVIPLFHPEDIYAVNKRISGISLKGVYSIEKRFNNIGEWVIDINP